MRPEFFDRAVANLDRRHGPALETLHPELLRRVHLVLADCGGAFKAWEGTRSAEKQREAYARGHSNAAPGQSPHNHEPSFAVDLVLDPRTVEVRNHPGDPRWPDLWDNESPAARAAWELLTAAAERHGLRRVHIGTGRRRRLDLPHLELFGWRDMLKG